MGKRWRWAAAGVLVGGVLGWFTYRTVSKRYNKTNRSTKTSRQIVPKPRYVRSTQAGRSLHNIEEEKDAEIVQINYEIEIWKEPKCRVERIWYENIFVHHVLSPENILKTTFNEYVLLGKLVTVAYDRMSPVEKIQLLTIEHPVDEMDLLIDADQYEDIDGLILRLDSIAGFNDDDVMNIDLNEIYGVIAIDDMEFDDTDQDGGSRTRTSSTASYTSEIDPEYLREMGIVDQDFQRYVERVLGDDGEVEETEYEFEEYLNQLLSTEDDEEPLFVQVLRQRFKPASDP